MSYEPKDLCYMRSDRYVAVKQEREISNAMRLWIADDLQVKLFHPSPDRHGAK